MIKPKMLICGDKVAIVSLSSGMAGDEVFRHRYEIGKKRLQNEFGLEVVQMPSALKGTEFIDAHPEARAKDLMDAFLDPSVRAVISCIGGDDTVRLLPFIDFAVLRNNPKIFMGYSDTTVNHFMMFKAGLMSFYGPSILGEFAENLKMHEYTKHSVMNTLFECSDMIELNSSPLWTSEYLDWADEKNDDMQRTMVDETRGYEVLQGSGIAEGQLLGGCVDVFPLFMGTDIWPKAEKWSNKILFLESSEDCPSPTSIQYTLRNMAAQGIIQKLNGVLVGKPKEEKYYDEYKEMYKDFFGREAKRPDLPIVYNMNFGHTAPMCILPYGAQCRIDCEGKKVILTEAVVEK